VTLVVIALVMERVAAGVTVNLEETMQKELVARQRRPTTTVARASAARVGT
jgi:hypothetical protein